MESPPLRIIGEMKGHWKEPGHILASGRLLGPAVHDARGAAICREPGVRQFWSAGRDFSLMAGFTVHNPLLR
jgi:hypothetical protein